MRDVFLYHAIRFFRLRGAREKAARGFAIGLACNFYPTFGLGGIFGGFLAHLCGGSIVAGFVGGTSLAFIWPIVFYLNIRAGALFLAPPIVVDDLEDVTERTIDALLWEKHSQSARSSTALLPFSCHISRSCYCSSESELPHCNGCDSASVTARWISSGL